MRLSTVVGHKLSKKIYLAAGVNLLVHGLALTVTPCIASDKPEPVKATVEVHATPEVVMEAIHHLRQDEPTGVKILSHNDHEATIEEIFDGLPIFGAARCVYKEQYFADRVEFHMIESDRLKAFDGWWKLTPVSSNVTSVELATGVDTGLRIPFARQITNAATLRNIREQLDDMKKSAESRQHAYLHRTL